MILVVMGVSGSGKSTIGEMLAKQLQCEFLDADDFHPPANKDKMRAGIALDDHDRWPWLDRLKTELTARQAQGQHCVLACSALKQRYRDRLGIDQQEIFSVQLEGTAETLQQRLSSRQHEFMSPALLRSQLQALEPARDGLIVDIADTPENIVGRISKWLACAGSQS